MIWVLEVYAYYVNRKTSLFAMINYNPNKPLISIHIPKTGGAGARKILTRWFKGGLYLHYYDEKNKTMPQKHFLLPNICIHGHFNRKRGFGIEHYYPGVDQFIMFLRDPFEILVSRYFYVKQNELKGRSYRDGMSLSLPDDINDFLRLEINKSDYHPNILDYFPHAITPNNYKSLINNSFVFIVFTDVYQLSINKLAECLGFPETSTSVYNASERFGEIDSELQRQFIKAHPLEYAVYNFARDKFLSMSN